jgi:hypothetical protein
MELTTVWFILIAVLWTGYFVLEGFDFGVGMLMPVLGHGGEQGELRKRVLLNTIGPVWDGNEVWLLTAGGAAFAAFPHWYATMFSGLYLPLLIILVALIVRALGFDYRGKVDDPTWRKRWDIAIFLGSAVPALLWGVALTNVVMGLPINADKEYTGNLFTLLNPGGAARRADHRGALPHPRCDLHRAQDRGRHPARGTSTVPQDRRSGGGPRGGPARHHQRVDRLDLVMDRRGRGGSRLAGRVVRRVPQA